MQSIRCVFVFTSCASFVTAEGVRYRIASGNNKYMMGLGLNGAERTIIIIVDIFNIIQKIRDTGIHLKGYSSRRRTRRAVEGHKREVRGKPSGYGSCIAESEPSYATSVK